MSRHAAGAFEPSGAGPSDEDQARRLLRLASQERRRRRRQRLVREAEVYALLALTDRPEGRGELGSAPAIGRVAVTSGVTLYDELIEFAGGSGIFAQVTLRLYDRILGREGGGEADAALAHYFYGVDRKRLERHMTAFLIALTGGSQQYEGRAMHAAHARLGITAQAWERFVWHLSETLREFRVPEGLIIQVEATATATSLHKVVVE